ncbi:carbohydrate ABC transporter permease [Trueperella pecoris]|uniref:Carbohydrate ABC transporter permease n=1 Tax=Trueperella pecoris TaxID=2733571 RepID=A0A7M1QWM1_9ACTO|nr:carbohydrate ABC transporter permease [Trueperella pecoris]QOR45745.1 carbohydrate ABC transporter permease [Trueperella pecoris]QTG75585.1 carbohydrate ABC transporter permease [Trueperella pecoris]
MTKTAMLPDGRRYVPSIEGVPTRSFAPAFGSKVIATIFMVIFLLYFVFPIYWMVIASTKTNAELTTTFGLWFTQHSDKTASPSLAQAITANYESLIGWTQGFLWRWIGNSFVYSTAAALIGTITSVMAGYALAKFNFPFKNTALGIIMAGLLMPVALLSVPIYVMFLNLGMDNTMASIIIPCAVSPFGVFLGRVYVQASVPTELIEAARIDGASEGRIFFTMVLRILAPAMVTIFLFIFVATWNNFILPQLMISSQELKPITLGLYGMASYFSPQYGPMMMASLLGVIPLIILFLALQRYWQAGLSAGSVKG